MPVVNGKTARRIENQNTQSRIPTRLQFSEANGLSRSITSLSNYARVSRIETKLYRLEHLIPEPTSFIGPTGLRGKRRSFMDQNSNYITIEMNLRLQMKDYRLVLGMKRTWIVALVVGAIQLIALAIKGHS